jgi:two-component sensor histidine kinase
VLFTIATHAQAKVTIADSMQKIEAFKLQYFYDHNKSHTIESVQKVEFNASTSNMFTFGFITGNSWFKLTIENQSEDEALIFALKEPYFQRIHFYSFEEGRWHKQKAGLNYYKHDLKQQHLTPIFRFTIKSNTTQTIYIQLAPDAKTAGATFGRFVLATQESFNRHSRINEYLFYSFFFGTIAIIVVFNLLIYIKFRDRLYLYYALYVMFLSIYIAIYSGVLHTLNIATLWHRELSLSMPLFFIFLLLFSNRFLKLNIYLPRVSKLFDGTALLYTISLPYMLYNYGGWIEIFGISTVLIGPLGVFCAIYVVYRGHKEAKFYLVGLLFYIAALSVLPLMTKGIIAHTPFTHYAYTVFSYIEIIFFSFVLVNRFYATQNEKIQLQATLLEIQKNNEKTLEAKVEKRTQEVEALLKQKEILLKEVYHRVKNNLHMVSSLLWMEYEKQKNEAQKTTLLELMNRVKSMALIHQYLLGMDDYSQIKAHDYLKHIVQEIKKSYTNNHAFSIDCRIDDFILSPDEALSLGIIINELLTNSLKHYDKGEMCHLQVHCIKQSQDIALMVSDNGEGFDYDRARYSGFGLQLIEEFATKLNPIYMQFNFVEGTRYELRFKTIY